MPVCHSCSVCLASSDEYCRHECDRVLVQFGHSFVIGLVLAAAYLKNGSLLQIVIVHFLIDYTRQHFAEQASISSVLHLIIFCSIACSGSRLCDCDYR